jgi:hypothetical protein
MPITEQNVAARFDELSTGETFIPLTDIFEILSTDFNMSIEDLTDQLEAA